MGNVPPAVLRQPPAPGSPMACNVDGGNTEMVRGSCTRTYYLRRYNRKRLTNIDSLAEDLLFDILVHLPAQDIYDQARLVCRKWYHMIYTHKFIYAHLQHAPYGLLFQIYVESPVFMSMRHGRIELSNYDYKFRFPVTASCNGLILEFDFDNHEAIYISNPTTKQIFVLPPFPKPILCKNLCVLAYVAATMEYKVVVTYYPDDVSKGQQCAILTVGVDKSWRSVSTEHLSPVMIKQIFYKDPLITEGFMHWAMGDGVLTLQETR